MKKWYQTLELFDDGKIGWEKALRQMQAMQMTAERVGNRQEAFLIGEYRQFLRKRR